MDNAFDNFLRHIDDIIPFLVFLLVVGIGVVRALFGAIGGARKAARPGRARPELRDFLEQLRQQGEAAQRRGSGEAGAEPPAAQLGRAAAAREEPPGPVGRQRVGGDPLAFPQAEPPARPEHPLRERREPPRRAEAPGRQRPVRRARDAARGAEAPRGRPGGEGRRAPRAAQAAIGQEWEGEPVAEEPLVRRLEERRLSRVESRHVQSSLADRHVAGKIAGRRIESDIGAAIARKFGASAKRRKRVDREGFAGLPPGFGLREGIILSTILGPPRAVRPYAPPWRRAAPGEPHV